MKNVNLALQISWPKSRLKKAVRQRIIIAHILIRNLRLVRKSIMFSSSPMMCLEENVEIAKRINLKPVNNHTVE